MPSLSLLFQWSYWRVMAISVVTMVIGNVSLPATSAVIQARKCGVPKIQYFIHPQLFISNYCTKPASMLLHILGTHCSHYQGLTTLYRQKPHIVQWWMVNIYILAFYRNDIPMQYRMITCVKNLEHQNLGSPLHQKQEISNAPRCLKTALYSLTYHALVFHSTLITIWII